ncbi:hypothetical protein NP493_422g02036 [Ridgeia piscesae]|uniref:Uncharacterized protein n=1 Tax=Ridgeia piscesae TaxID=27915 RepID=A0AAD9NS91_RIDPI|nr:hypothetical protein NP493_4002g00000 [Ridgeia piscesae]KAK2180892.1 hypothetical protein NP493_422g02036 [Ridgeia piscesae]
MAARSLKLVANCLIKLANLTEAKTRHIVFSSSDLTYCF